MLESRIEWVVMLSFVVLGCATEAPPEPEEDVAAVLEMNVEAPPSCEPLVAIIRPIAAPHFHDETLQQTAGRLTLRVGDRGVRTGTSLATIVGLDADGAPLGNHDWLFADAGLRTQNDTVALVPMGDSCMFDVTSTINIVEGTGGLDGLTGTAVGVGFLSFCGAEGFIEITGHVCP